VGMQARSAVQLINSGFILQPDVLAQFEFDKAHERCERLNSEERLMFAVLTDAIECFQKYIFAKPRRLRALFNQAEAWFLNREDPSLFSFDNICQVLHISPSYLRSGLMSWRMAQRERRSCQKQHRKVFRPQTRLRSPRIAL
jgi:hypothetical protein